MKNESRDMLGRHLLSRRESMGSMAFGLSSIAMTGLLSRQGALAADLGEDGPPIRPKVNAANPNAKRDDHFAPKAKNVLMIFCSGACSHLDTFDYKPAIIERNGQPLPGGDELITFQGKQGNLTRSPWEFKPRGESGKMVSTLVDLSLIHI